MNFSNIEANINGMPTGIILQSTKKEEIFEEFLKYYPQSKIDDITMICIYEGQEEKILDL